MQKPTCSLLFDKLLRKTRLKTLWQQRKSKGPEEDARMSLPRTLLHNSDLTEFRASPTLSSMEEALPPAPRDDARTASRCSGTSLCHPVGCEVDKGDTI